MSYFQVVATDREPIITGSDPVLHSIEKGILERPTYFKVSHEEVEEIIANHVVHAARHNCNTILVICDDTDVFVLLVYFYTSEGLHSNIFLVPTKLSKDVIDIGATVLKHSEITKYILPLHALTGCF